MTPELAAILYKYGTSLTRGLDDAALAYHGKAIKQGYVLDKAGYEYVKKHAKVGA